MAAAAARTDDNMESPPAAGGQATNALAVVAEAPMGQGLDTEAAKRLSQEFCRLFRDSEATKRDDDLQRGSTSNDGAPGVEQQSRCKVRGLWPVGDAPRLGLQSLAMAGLAPERLLGQEGGREQVGPSDRYVVPSWVGVGLYTTTGSPLVNDGARVPSGATAAGTLETTSPITTGAIPAMTSRKEKDSADSEKWGNWASYRMWRQKIQRWRRATDIAVWMQGDRLFKALDAGLQRKLEDISDDILCSDEGVDAIIGRLDLMSGERHGDERGKVARECLLDFARRHNENLTAYCARIDAALNRAVAQGLVMPDEWQLMLFEEGVGLTRQSAQSAVGPSMKGWILEMDISHRERLQRPQGRLAHVAHDSSGTASMQTQGAVPPPPVPPSSWQVEGDAADDSLIDYSDVSPMASVGEMAVFAALEAADVGEDDAPEALAAIDEERRETWKERNDLKRRLKVDRKFFDISRARGGDGREKPRRPSRGAAGGAFRPRKNRLPLAELIKRTRCRLCHQKRHWSKECPNKSSIGGGSRPPQKPEQGSSPFAGLSFVRVSALGGFSARATEGPAHPPPPSYAAVLLSAGPGAVIAGAAAGQDGRSITVATADRALNISAAQATFSLFGVITFMEVLCEHAAVRYSTLAAARKAADCLNGKALWSGV
ncbi:unnamed protein product [Prorocentrum cordatum]|uniref:CCHC-type domain-containing protein n=1 Tax=Prorocentrum cordatum TaxID=2364126 RepID=A0ABN9QYJ2_9DINO|nr:unnamed protein product [Polarella glacialis]